MESNFGFTYKDKESFKYWFAHWCAFQMIALDVHDWKFKYLFHDFEKPWLYLILSSNKVKKIHRKYSDHHLAYHKGFDKIDWEALAIDWECSRFTKAQDQMSAFSYWQYVGFSPDSPLDEKTKQAVNENLPRVLKKYKYFQ